MTCGPPRRVCWKPVPTEHAAVHEDTGSCTGSTGRTNKNLGIGCFLATGIRNDDVGFWRREVACGETLGSGRKGRTLAPGSRYPNPLRLGRWWLWPTATRRLDRGGGRVRRGLQG